MLAIPGFFGSALDPFIGVLGDTRRRRALVLAGGVVFAVSAALTALATGFWWLLLALCIGNPATTAFVSMAQASLMDREPAARERNMARWTLAGSAGVVGGPVVLTIALALGAGWRAATAVCAIAAITLTAWASAYGFPGGADGTSLAQGLRGALAALREREVLRWLAVLEAADLLLDVFHGFLALYFVDVARFSAANAALALAAWTGASLVGDVLLLLVLRRVSGVSYLRVTAAVVALVYPAFLLVQPAPAKLGLLCVLGVLNSGWYAIPKARLYAALPGRSGTAVAVGTVGGLLGPLVPLALGLAADAFGLGLTMWVLLAAPVALLAVVPRSSRVRPWNGGVSAS